MKPLDKHRTLLLRAADIMEERGHCKRQLENDLGHVCVMQALFIARYERAEAPRAIDGAFDLLRDFVGDCPVNWNNAPERTAEEVIAGLRAAAVHNL